MGGWWWRVVPLRYLYLGPEPPPLAIGISTHLPLTSEFLIFQRSRETREIRPLPCPGPPAQICSSLTRPTDPTRSDLSRPTPETDSRQPQIPRPRSHTVTVDTNFKSNDGTAVLEEFVTFIETRGWVVELSYDDPTNGRAWKCRKDLFVH